MIKTPLTGALWLFTRRRVLLLQDIKRFSVFTPLGKHFQYATYLGKVCCGVVEKGGHTTPSSSVMLTLLAVMCYQSYWTVSSGQKEKIFLLIDFIPLGHESVTPSNHDSNVRWPGVCLVLSVPPWLLALADWEWGPLLSWGWRDWRRTLPLNSVTRLRTPISCSQSSGRSLLGGSSWIEMWSWAWMLDRAH